MTKFNIVASLIALVAVASMAVFITKGTFDFFGSETFGLAYNAYAESIFSGTLAIDTLAIGGEGFYHNDKVYMYSGILPALYRGVLLPFLDLSNLYVSRIFVLFFAAGGALMVHLYVLRLYGQRLSGENRETDRLIMLTFLVNLWMCSAYFILAVNASVHHEPIVTGLFLSTLFVILVFDGIFIKKKFSGSLLMFLSLLAALCLHARVTMAVGLYASTVVLVMIRLWDDARVLAAEGEKRNRLLCFLREEIRSPSRGVFPMVIMLVSGLVYMGLNYARWGNPFIVAPIEEYGYYVYGEGMSERIVGIMEYGRLNIARIPANLVFHFFGGWDLHSLLLDIFDGGFVRKDTHTGIAVLLWPITIALSIVGCRELFLNVKNGGDYARTSLLIAAALSIPFIMILAFDAAALRYKADIWVLFLFLSLAGLFRMREWLSRSTIRTKEILSRITYTVTFVSILYNIKAMTDYRSVNYFKGIGAEWIVP